MSKQLYVVMAVEIASDNVSPVAALPGETQAQRLADRLDQRYLNKRFHHVEAVKIFNSAEEAADV